MSEETRKIEGLELNRETLRDLTAEQAEQAQGGLILRVNTHFLDETGCYIGTLLQAS